MTVPRDIFPDAIVSAILEGDLDEHFDEISEAMRSRRSRIDDAKRFTFKQGDRVQFNNSVKPRYLAGVPATVVGRANSRILIKLDYAAGRFSPLSEIRCPVSIIDKIEEGAA